MTVEDMVEVLFRMMAVNLILMVVTVTVIVTVIEVVMVMNQGNNDCHSTQ